VITIGIGSDDWPTHQCSQCTGRSYLLLYNKMLAGECPRLRAATFHFDESQCISRQPGQNCIPATFGHFHSGRGRHVPGRIIVENTNDRVQLKCRPMRDDWLRDLAWIDRVSRKNRNVGVVISDFEASRQYSVVTQRDDQRSRGRLARLLDESYVSGSCDGLKSGRHEPKGKMLGEDNSFVFGNSKLVQIYAAISDPTIG
jgi:hypothetical protein